jgi:hypothetical protein
MLNPARLLFKHAMTLSILDKIEDVFLVECHIEFSEQLQVFILEGSFTMMFFLSLNISDDCAQLRMRIRESAEAFLPVESSSQPSAFVYEF